MTSGWGLRIGEAVLGGVVLGLGLFVAIETSLMEVAASNAAIGPRLFPFLIAFGLLAVGVPCSGRPSSAISRTSAASSSTGGRWPWSRAACILQMFLVESLGWIIATTLLFVAATLAFRERRVLISIAIGLVLTCLTYWVFNYGLGLSLPIGTTIEELLPSSDEEAE